MVDRRAGDDPAAARGAVEERAGDEDAVDEVVEEVAGEDVEAERAVDAPLLGGRVAELVEGAGAREPRARAARVVWERDAQDEPDGVAREDHDPEAPGRLRLLGVAGRDEVRALDEHEEDLRASDRSSARARGSEPASRRARRVGRGRAPRSRGARQRRARTSRR